MSTINSNQILPQVSSILTQGIQGRNTNRVEPPEPVKVAMESEQDMNKQRVERESQTPGRLVDIRV